MGNKSRVEENAWADLAHRERVYLAVIYGYVPATVLFLIIATAFTGDVPAWFGIAAGLAGIFAFCLASAYLMRFRCPSCGKAFSNAVDGPGRRCAYCHSARGTPENNGARRLDV